MPIKTKTSKTKPAAVEAPKPEPPQPTAWQKRHAEAERQFQELQELARIFVEETNLEDFKELRTFKLILDRYKGDTTPVEAFITNLVLHYGRLDDDGKGMTLEDIESELQQSITDNDNLADIIKNAHFMASRYPLPEPETADATA